MSEDYKKLMDLVGQVKALAKETIQADQAKRLSMADTLRDFFSSLKDGGAGREAFNNANEAAIRNLSRAVYGLETLCQTVVKHLHIPDQLQREGEQWQRALEEIKQIADTAPGREHVPGWTGPAAEAYTRAAKVQTEACKEWAGLTEVVVQLYGKGYKANLAVLEAIYQCVLHLTEQRSYLPEPNEFFAATKWLAALIWYTIERINELEHILQDTSEKLSADLVAAKNAPNLIGQDWPEGDALFGVEAAYIPQIGSHRLPDMPTEVEEPTTKGNYRFK